MSFQDLENMSDEELMKLDNPGAATAAPVEESADEPEPPVEEPEAPEAAAPEEPASEDVPAEDTAEEPVEEAPSLFDETPGSTLEEDLDKSEAEPTEESEDTPGSETAETAAEDSDKADQSTPDQSTAETSAETPAEDPGETVDEPAPEATVAPEQPATLSAEDAYAKIMAPFKANGREFTPRDPDEVIKLMQMGAGYAKKMQSLKPNLKMMQMLENKGLLNEDKLNFLIDLEDRNPKAIQKLLQDAKIDPLDLDTSQPAEYTPNNHAVSDEQYSFQETLNDVMSASGGQETVQIVNQSWDKASKEALFEDPKILPLIHEHRENGVYEKIETEIERQKMLGKFTNTPFIHAYKAVGDYLQEQGLLFPASPEPEPAPATTAADQLATAAQEKPRELVETRTANPRTNLANDDRVASAAVTRASPSPAKKRFDPLTMSDEEIMAMSVPHS